MKKILAAVLLAGIASAGIAGTTGSINILGGYAIPVSGDWADYFDGSFATAIAADIDTSENIAVGLEYGYNPNHGSSDAPFGVRVQYLTPYVKWQKNGESSSLYFLVGAGLYSAKLHIGAINEYTTDAFGINVGGGFLFKTSETTRFGLDLRWHHAIDPIYPMMPADANNIVPSLKFSYLFGNK